MELLSQTSVSLPDSIASISSAENLVCHSSHEPMTFINLTVICLTIILCLAIVAVAVYRCFNAYQNNLISKLDKKNTAEEEKRKSEQNAKVNESRLESAWRCVKETKDKEDKASESQKKALEAAWKYITNHIKLQDVEPSEGAQEPKQDQTSDK